MKIYEIVFALSLLLILCICIYNNSNKSFFTAKKGTCGIGKNTESFLIDMAKEALADDSEEEEEEEEEEGFSVGCSSCTKKEHFDVGGPFLDGSKKCKVTMIWADWCGYSNKAKPQWEKLVQEYQGTDIYGYKMILNAVEEKEFKKNKELMKKFNVEGYPSFYVELSDKNKIVDFNSIEKDDMYAKIKKSINEIQEEKEGFSVGCSSCTKKEHFDVGGPFLDASKNDVDNSDKPHNVVQIDKSNVHPNNLEDNQYAPILVALQGSQMNMPSQKQLQLPGIDAVQGVPVACYS